MDLSKLTPADATVTLRGLERRYRAVFAGLGDEESPDDVARRQSGGWSALDHVVAAARGLSTADRALQVTLTQNDPVLGPPDLEAIAGPHPGAPTGTLHERLAELGLEANALADRIQRVPPEDWARTATVADGSGRTLTALDVVRAAVDAGITHLRAAQDVLSAVV
ncbi:MAG TPA: hypothetical protein VF743_03460 [Acidimicrobiales bacterium]